MTKKKKLIITGSIISILLIAGGVYYFFFSSYSDQRKANKELDPTVNQMKDVAMEPTASINPGLKNDIDVLLKQKKYTEAREQIQQLLGEQGLSNTDKSELYIQLSEACLALKDVDCLSEVMDYYKTALGPDLRAIIKSARLAKEQGQMDRSREWYQLALEVIEKQGGIEEINKLNKITGAEPINYDEIKQGAGQ